MGGNLFIYISLSVFLLEKTMRKGLLITYTPEDSELGDGEKQKRQYSLPRASQTN